MSKWGMLVIGQVLKRGTVRPDTVKVRCLKMKLDNHLNKVRSRRGFYGARDLVFFCLAIGRGARAAMYCFRLLDYKCAKVVIHPQKLGRKSRFGYFNGRKHYWAVEGDIKTDIGDIILIERLPEKLTPLVTHEIKEQVFKIGAVVDPVTGNRCRGTIFIDEELRQLEAEQIEEEREKKASRSST
ncbi:uncharacterized protein [Littorina saxatilis]|uniref:uncharacterized protein n=1 Tax=Littorina saxatilis TaxID=31220 RepID=UPI0038B4C87C